MRKIWKNFQLLLMTDGESVRDEERDILSSNDNFWKGISQTLHTRLHSQFYSGVIGDQTLKEMEQMLT